MIFRDGVALDGVQVRQDLVSALALGEVQSKRKEPLGRVVLDVDMMGGQPKWFELKPMKVTCVHHFQGSHAN